MSVGTPATFIRNASNLFRAVATFSREAPKALAVYNLLKSRAYDNAPSEYVNQKESWELSYWKRHHNQKDNMWVDKGLKDVLSQKELAAYINFRYDFYKISHPLTATASTGGWGLLAWPIWLANDTWMPSFAMANKETLKEWRTAQDLYRYKYAPAMITDFRWWYEHHQMVPQNKSAGWEELFEKNDVRRDPALCASVSDMYSRPFPFFHIRRKQSRAIGRAMGLPTFPQFGKICLQTRIRDYWELLWNEDYMVITTPGALEALGEEQLFDYAWRRFLAPVDKNLTKEQILGRVKDYFAFLETTKFSETTQAPNIFVTISYCLAYYNDPAYLTGDISELDGDDYAHLQGWGRDAFLRRLEFENGPLRDQVEAAGFKALEERKKKLEAPIA